MSKKQTASVISAWGSFTIVPNEVLESDLSPRAVLVFIALMSRVSHDAAAPKCWPSYEAIAERCAIKARASISAAIDELEQKGFLKRDKRFSASTVYTLLRPRSSHDERMVDCAVVQNVNDSSSQCEQPVIHNVNANKIQVNKIQEQDPISSNASALEVESTTPSALPSGEIDWFADDPVPQPETKQPETKVIQDEAPASTETLKRVRKARQQLSEHEAKRHQELFAGLARICVMDTKLRSVAGQIARAAKELREGDPSATDATMTEFLEWWKTSDFRGRSGKPPTPQQVITSWKLFRGNYAERPSHGINHPQRGMSLDKIMTILADIK